MQAADREGRAVRRCTCHIGAASEFGQKRVGGSQPRRLPQGRLSLHRGARSGAAAEPYPTLTGAAAQVADFQWVPGAEPGDPFTMVSVSDNGVGGTLQLWRINDMIWRPEDLVLAELEEHRRGPRP
jgi:hypothetical protein